MKKDDAPRKASTMSQPPAPRLSAPDYAKVQEAIEAISTALTDLPLTEFIATAESNEELGPFVDPVLFAKAHKKLRAIILIACKLHPVQVEIARLRREGVL